jgi:integrase
MQVKRGALRIGARIVGDADHHVRCAEMPGPTHPIRKINVSAAATAQWTSTDHTVSDLAQRWIDEAVPANTRRAYAWAWSRYTDWCTRTGRVALPATAETLTEHVAYLRAIGARPATIDQAIGVILSIHKSEDQPKPDTDKARHILRGYRRELAEDGWAQRQALPFSRDTLHQTVAALDLTTPRGRRDQVLLVLGFSMMARRSELAALTIADVTEGPDGLDVAVRSSKTDKQSRGRVVALPPQNTPELDPVRLVRAWCRDLGDRGPLLRHLDLAGRTAGAITGHGINHAVRAAVRRAGIPEADRYTAHSLRAGGFTDALRRHVPVSIAARHGGWDPESPTVLRYARAADRWRDNAMAGAF